jgi:hypothetical protein
VRRKYFVCYSAKQQIKGFTNLFVHHFAKKVIKVSGNPTFVLETSSRIFLRTAWSLHHAV